MPAGAKDPRRPDQDAFGFFDRHVLDALARVDQVERAVGVLRQVRHGVVAVLDRAELRLDDVAGHGLFVELVAIIGGKVDDDELVEGVGVAHEDHGPLVGSECGPPQVEDATGPAATSARTGCG